MKSVVVYYKNNPSESFNRVVDIIENKTALVITTEKGSTIYTTKIFKENIIKYIIIDEYFT